MESFAQLDHRFHNCTVHGMALCPVPRWRPSGFASGIVDLDCHLRVLGLGFSYTVYSELYALRGPPYC